MQQTRIWQAPRAVSMQSPNVVEILSLHFIQSANTRVVQFRFYDQQSCGKWT